MNKSGKFSGKSAGLSIWTQLKSMKFAVWILVILAVVSLVSMFFVEFFPVDDNISNWKSVYSERYGALFPFIHVFHLQDPYRSWWYQALLGVLTLSLMLCVIERLPAGFKRAFRRRFTYNHEAILRYPEKAVVKTHRNFLGRLRLIFRGYSLQTLERDGVVYLRGDRSALGYLGSPLIHTGLLLLVIGGLLAIWGKSTRGAGYPGDVIESEHFDFKVRVDDFYIEYYPLGVGQWVLVDSRSLGKVTGRLAGGEFQVRFYTRDGSVTHAVDSTRIRNKFDIETDAGNVKDYICDLTVIDGGVEVFSRRIEVNKPLRYKGFRFYQSSFSARNPRVAAAVDSVVIEIRRQLDGEVVDTIAAAPEEPRILPDGSVMSATKFLPDFRLGEEGAVSASDNMLNPAVKVKVFRGEEELYHQWSFLNAPFHSASPNAVYTFQVLDLINPRAEAEYATILEIKENYGYEVIWAGLILATIGSILLFYLSPRHLWAMAVFDGEESIISLGGYSARSKAAFTAEFQKIVSKIEKIS